MLEEQTKKTFAFINGKAISKSLDIFFSKIHILGYYKLASKHIYCITCKRSVIFFAFYYTRYLNNPQQHVQCDANQMEVCLFMIIPTLFVRNLINKA